MEREVRYCTTEDGVRIAYRCEGRGYPLVVPPVFVEAFEEDASFPEYVSFLNELGRTFTIVRYDSRGTGLSRRDVTDASHGAMVRDLAAVCRAIDVPRLSLLGSTLAGPRAIDFAAGGDQQVDALILHGTYASPSAVMSADQLRSLADLARVNWELASQVFADTSVRAEFPDFGPRIAALYRVSASGEFVSDFLLQNYETGDVRHLLERVTVPTLILHSVHDQTFPFSQAQELAAGVPNARLIALEGTVHHMSLGDAPYIIDRIRGFIAEYTGGTAPSEPSSGSLRPLQVVLFTDLVGHTEMMRRLGDRAGREALREHERITRDTLAQHGGVELKTMGDGFMATFPSAIGAMDCAIALQRAFAEHAEQSPEPFRVRMGLNAGEPLQDGADVFGLSVILAARVAAQADGGEILIPEPVRHLLTGKDYVFADRGEYFLKGFEDRMRLFEVHWQP
jgi:class 3 adenylate cyclase